MATIGLVIAVCVFYGAAEVFGVDPAQRAVTNAFMEAVKKKDATAMYNLGGAKLRSHTSIDAMTRDLAVLDVASFDTAGHSSSTSRARIGYEVTLRDPKKSARVKWGDGPTTWGKMRGDTWVDVSKVNGEWRIDSCQIVVTP